MPRSNASGMVFTNFAVVTLRFACPNSYFAARASPVSCVKIVAAPLRPAYKDFHSIPFSFSVGAMSCRTITFKSRGKTRSFSPAFAFHNANVILTGAMSGKDRVERWIAERGASPLRCHSLSP
jgi:hypothetical protein